jgi:hypothetical protein
MFHLLVANSNEVEVAKIDEVTVASIKEVTVADTNKLQPKSSIGVGSSAPTTTGSFQVSFTKFPI